MGSSDRTSRVGQDEGPPVNPSWLEAITQKLDLINFSMNEHTTRLARLEEQVGHRRQATPMPTLRRGTQPNQVPRYEEPIVEEECESEDEELTPRADLGRYRGEARGRDRVDRGEARGREREGRGVDNIKMKIPPYQGRNDPDVYLEWERKVDLVFDCHAYSEEKKIKLAVVEFTDYAIV